ncbi:hypothetical protein BH09PAT1_BH09PAT1_1400 [soil metagenome]
MSLKSIRLKSEVATLNKVVYDTETHDMTMYYTDGAVVRYMNVLPSIIEELQQLKTEGLTDDAIINYLTDALSKHYKKTRTFKYNKIVIKRPNGALDGEVINKYGIK